MSSVQYYPGYSQVQVSNNLLVRTIASISQANPMVITTTEPHEYVIGMVVRFLIPIAFGMTELNGLTGQVIDLTSDTLTINLSSLGFNAFAYPSPLPTAYTPPSVIPNSSGPVLTPTPLPFGNQTTFDGVIYNNGLSS